MVALNAALVLWAAGCTDSITSGLERTLESLASGAPWQKLLALRQALQQPAGG